MAGLEDHDLRYALVSELHARPFPALSAPCMATFIAITEPEQAERRDRSRDTQHLCALLDRHGAGHPQPGANHFSTAIGRAELKWESHTEFVTYSAFSPGLSTRPFDPSESEVFPADWLANAPGKRIAALLIRVEIMPADEALILDRVHDWLVPESLAVSRVVDGAAIIAGDFRIDPAGQMRFAVFVRPDAGARRIGRIVQRLCEIETYRAMAMLGLTRARDLSERLNVLDPRLADLVSNLDKAALGAEAVLHELLRITGELESLAVTHSFRFGATGAYETIVNQRVTSLREERLGGRQTFGEFMMRRFDPAMRTVTSADRRLQSMAKRAGRAAELLRTRVDVERSAENQSLLESMDRRADLALRLQHTVEGLSVVAISYYAVALADYTLSPFAEAFGLSEVWMKAILTPIVALLVWGLIRRLRRKIV